MCDVRCACVHTTHTHPQEICIKCYNEPQHIFMAPLWPSGWCHLVGVRHFYYHLIFVTFHHDFNASSACAIVPFACIIHIDRSLIAIFIASKLSFRINFQGIVAICHRAHENAISIAVAIWRDTCRMNAREMLFH